MIHPVDGSATLEARVTYLKRRREGRLGTRGVLMTWAGVGALCTWVLAAAVAGFLH